MKIHPITRVVTLEAWEHKRLREAADILYLVSPHVDADRLLVEVTDVVTFVPECVTAADIGLLIGAVATVVKAAAEDAKKPEGK